MSYKRLMVTAFAAAACLLCRADAPAVNDVWTEGGLNYKVSQKADESLYLTLTGWVSATNEVVVPATVTKDDETLPVLEIGKAAFGPHVVHGRRVGAAQRACGGKSDRHQSFVVHHPRSFRGLYADDDTTIRETAHGTFLANWAK